MTKALSTRTFLIGGLLVALLIAGVVSYYASSSPDGLNHVAAEKGFDRTATEHASAGSPMADYATKGVDNGRLSGGIAGVTGVVVVLVLAGGLALVLRRRSPAESA